MNFAADYSRVIRYGRVDADALRAFAAKGREDGEFDPHNNADAVFADHLEDANDPRHLIVRRDLQYRSNDKNNENLDFWNNLSNHRDELAGKKLSHSLETDRYAFPDNSRLQIDSYHGLLDPEQIPLVHHVAWVIPTNTRNNHILTAAVTPDELHKILGEFGIQHIASQSS
jgi:hypothetical protein